MSSSSHSRSRALSRQAATKAAQKFEAQLASSPGKSDGGTPPKRRAKSRGPGAKSQPARTARRPVPVPVLSKSQVTRKRVVSLGSPRSDNEEFDLTSLSTAPGTPKATTWPDTDSFSNNYVFVLLDFNGTVFELDQEDDGEERVWWPAVVRPSTDSIYRVTLFGSIGSLDLNATIELDCPHTGNVIPLCAPSGAIQFTSPNYVISSGQSPRKRQRLDRSDLEARWHASLSAVVTHIMHNEAPGIPFVGSISSVKLNDDVVPEIGTEVTAAEEPSDAHSDAASEWDPPLPDAFLSIPGELVLACDKRVYWPARILDFVPPPPKRRGPGQYRVQWVDNTEAKIPRAMFYTYEQDEFGTCPLGRYESLYEDVVNDKDEDDQPRPDNNKDHTRRDSPEPLDPPPCASDFEDLSVHEQFVYTKPVLQAILRDEYEPAREFHEMFIAGGKRREEVAKKAALRGLMDPRDVDEFQECLVEWCLRARKVVQMDDDTDAADKRLVGDDKAPTPNSDCLVKTVTVPFPVDEALASTDAFTGDVDAALQETLCTPPSPSDTSRIECPSSPALPPPPSSLITIENDPPPMGLDEVMEANDVPSSAPVADNVFNASFVLSEASDVSSLLTSPGKKGLEAEMAKLKSPRQIGCPAYERLPDNQKLDYCTNVLLPQLVIQVLLWRTGARSSVALLSLEEEKRLNELGTEERSKTDWVSHVRQLREQKERELKNEEVVVGGTASRPKKGRK